MGSGSDTYGQDIDGRDAEAGSSQRRGLPIDGFRVFQLIWRGKWWLALAAMIGCMGGVAAAKLVVGRTYQAYALMVFEGLPNVEGMPSRGSQEFATLVGEIRTPSNLRKVMDVCDVDLPIQAFFETVEVTSPPGSNRVIVSTQSESAEGAAKLADSLLDVFIESRVDIERERVEKHLRKVEDDLSLARKSLKSSRGTYDVFRKEHGIVDLSAEQEQAIKAAAELQTKADLARAEAEAETMRAKQLRAAQRKQRSTAVITEHQSSPDVARLSEARTKLAQARSSLSSDHPQVLALEAQVKALQSRSSQSRRITSERVVGVNPAYTSVAESAAGAAANRDAARASEETLQVLSKAARERVEQLTEVEGETSKLLSAVQISEKRLAVLESIRGQVLDASRNPTSGFRIEERAETPEQPLSSRKKLVVAAGIPTFMVFIILAWLVTRELWGLRVKTAAEVGYWGRGTVIGSTAWPSDPAALEDFLGELDDYLPDLQGATLVVGATPGSVELAGDVARGLMKAVFLTHQFYAMEKASASVQPAGLLEAPKQINDSPNEYIDSTGEVIDVDVAPDDDDAEVVIEAEGESRDTLPSSLGQSSMEPYAGKVAQVAVSSKPKVGYWNGPETGPAIRRAARLADRVLVVVPAGATSIFNLLNTHPRLGRQRGIGYVLVNLESAYSNLPDRSGNQEEFWFYFKG